MHRLRRASVPCGLVDWAVPGNFVACRKLSGQGKSRAFASNVSESDCHMSIVATDGLPMSTCATAGCDCTAQGSASGRNNSGTQSSGLTQDSLTHGWVPCILTPGWKHFAIELPGRKAAAGLSLKTGRRRKSLKIVRTSRYRPSSLRTS